MKVLVLDHHFRQDIDALVRSNNAGHVIRTVSPLYFARAAERLFPPEVFSADLSVYHRPCFHETRASFRRLAIDLLYDLYRVFPFDLFVSPSDTFFYIRDVIDACHDIGIPFAVVQKEAYVTATAVDRHAPEMNRWFPFKGDWMTTSCHRSMRFWLATGAEVRQVEVTGQPRYDYYTYAAESGSITATGRNRTRILFLSYDLDAYDESRAIGVNRSPWAQLHAETEDVLRAVARHGDVELVVKPHPQQSAAMVEAMRQRLGGSLSVNMAEGGADTRKLIMHADVIVGFQTTALAEAMAVGKRVVYTAWTPAFEDVKRHLLPYHELSGCIEVATSPTDLLATLKVRCSQALTASQREQRRAFVEEYLGPFDGGAGNRVWCSIERRLAAWRADGMAAERRRFLSQEIDTFSRTEEQRGRRQVLVRRALVCLACRCFGGGSWVCQRLSERLQRAAARVVECQEACKREYRLFAELVGREDENLLMVSLAFVARRLAPSRAQSPG